VQRARGGLKREARDLGGGALGGRLARIAAAVAQPVERRGRKESGRGAARWGRAARERENGAREELGWREGKKRSRPD
jgi:hypothetical protein